MGAFVILGAWLCLRIALWTVMKVCEIVATLLFAPLFPPRRRHGPRPSKRRIRYAEDEYYEPRPRRRPPVVPPTPTPPREPSRNERDCALALEQLGWPRARARCIAEEVARELGPDAPLNDMVKRGCQIVGTAR